MFQTLSQTALETDAPAMTGAAESPAKMCSAAETLNAMDATVLTLTPATAREVLGPPTDWLRW